MLGLFAEIYEENEETGKMALCQYHLGEVKNGGWKKVGGAKVGMKKKKVLSKT